MYSANFCFGVLITYDTKVLGRMPNGTEISAVANQSGFDNGAQNDTATPEPACNVLTAFCDTFNKAYNQSYKFHISYYLGNAAGTKYANQMIATCTKDIIDLGFLNHHSALFKKGFWSAYRDTFFANVNSDGT